MLMAALHGHIYLKLDILWLILNHWIWISLLKKQSRSLSKIFYPMISLLTEILEITD